MAAAAGFAVAQGYEPRPTQTVLSQHLINGYASLAYHERVSYFDKTGWIAATERVEGEEMCFDR